MRSRTIRWSLACLALLAVFPVWAQEAVPYPRISEEGFRARLPFFDYDTTLPLEARVVLQRNADPDDADPLEQKIVFRGAQGFLVPGYLDIPKKAGKPCPLVLLLHGWSGSKDVWNQDGGGMAGGDMRDALLEAGYATLALDAATHGERSNEIDYMHVNAFDDPKAPPRHNYFTFAEITVQTIKDYRRALDYLATRDEIDMNRIGLVGYSMGGMDSFFLLSVEPRIKVAVACVPPLYSPGYSATTPVDYTWGVGNKPLLMLMGRNDDMYDYATVTATYKAYIETPQTKIVWYDQGHMLTRVYVPDALAWIKDHV